MAKMFGHRRRRKEENRSLNRIKNPKLAVFDSEGVLFDVGFEENRKDVAASSWSLITWSLGEQAREEEKEGSARWNRREFKSYTDWMINTIKIHHKYGITKEKFFDALSSITPMNGAVTAVNSLRKMGYIIAVISGGIQNLLDIYKDSLKIDIAFTAAEYFFGRKGMLERVKLFPCDYEGKGAYIRDLQRVLGVKSEDTLCIVDGVNDRYMARRAGISINFHGRKEMEEVCTHTIRDRPKNLADVLKYVP